MPEKIIFVDFLKKKGLKLTRQREVILEVFLKTEKHLSVEDLYKIVKKKDKTIGQATVFRTLRLLSEADLARETDLGDKKKRFEHKYNHTHHDHLVCIECNKLIEAVNPQIEKLQNDLCVKAGFKLLKHRLEIFGICKQCQRKEGEAARGQ